MEDKYLKKSNKIVLSLVVLTILLCGGVSASAYSFDTFFGGVTGIPGFGSTWGEFTPSSRNVVVEAVGKQRKIAKASARRKAYAAVPRAFSGNRSRWWWG